MSVLTIFKFLDEMELPSTLPSELRRSTELARAVRANPVLLKIVEGFVVHETTGSLDAFGDKTTIDYLQRHGGDEGVAKYKAAAANVPDDVIDIAHTIGWRVSPLTTACVLGKERGQPFDPALHLRLVSDAVVDAVSGRGKRFIAVSMPPRHGKSHMVARRTPEWLLANYPQLSAAVMSYGDEFAGTWGRLVRNDLQDSPGIFGFGIAPDSSAAQAWHTVHGGGLWCAGVGGAATGKGGSLIVLDDVLKNHQEASSVARRDEIFSWWSSVARTRLMQGGIICAVGTRWHSDDLIGRLLRGYGGADPNEWLEIRLPAICEKEGDPLGRKKGEALWPGGGFDAEELSKTKAAVGESDWSAMYMQTPLDETSIGKCYHAFSEKNVVDVEYDNRLHLTVGFDFNIDPASAVIMQFEERFGSLSHLNNRPIREARVLDEISLADSNTQTLADEVIERLRELSKGQKIVVDVCGDASGNQRRSSASAAAPTDWAIIRTAFNRAHQFQVSYHIEKSNPSQRERVTVFNSMLCDGLGQRHLLIHSRCRQLLLDLRGCKWKRDLNGNVTSQIAKDDPKRGHMSDAAGYAVYQHREGLATFGLKAGWAR